MGGFDVVLEIIRGAEATGETLEMKVLATDRLSAALTAEANADRVVREPKTMYSHALSVTPINTPGANAPEACALAA